MEFLKFIFSSPWIWLGFLILVCCVLKYTVDLAWLFDFGLLCSEIHGGSGECSPRKAESSHIQDERRQLAGTC